MMPEPAPLADITIVGAGLDGFEHLTAEAQRVVRLARVVFYSPVNGPLPRRCVSPLATLIDIERGEYRIGDHRPEMYRRMAALVICAGCAGAGVVVLQPGSAVVVDAVTTEILEAATAAGLTVQLLCGVSSVEAVMCMVGYDLAEGLQVFLAQNLVRFDQTLRPSLAAIVLQPGYFDTRCWTGAARSRLHRFDRLAAQLRRTHPADAVMCLVVAASRAARRPSSALWFRLADFEAVAAVLSPLHTLFVPAVVRPSAADADFERRLDEWDAVLEAVEHTDDGQPRCEGARYWFGLAARELPPHLVEQSAALAAAWEARRPRRNGRGDLC